jgi:hypothetical protein
MEIEEIEDVDDEIMKSPVRINESVNLGRTHTNDFEDLEDDELNDSSICMSQTPFR